MTIRLPAADLPIITFVNIQDIHSLCSSFAVCRSAWSEGLYSLELPTKRRFSNSVRLFFFFTIFARRRDKMGRNTALNAVGTIVSTRRFRTETPAKSERPRAISGLWLAYIATSACVSTSTRQNSHRRSLPQFSSAQHSSSIWLCRAWTAV